MSEDREFEAAISTAIIATEKEIAGAAWGEEDTDALDATGDRSMEDMGDGLEGQIEPDDDDDAGGEDADGEAESEGDGETAEAAAAAAAAEKSGKDGQPEKKPDGRTEPGGRVPSGEYRKVADRARAAEAERDALKAAIDKSNAESQAKLDLVMREIAALKTAPRNEPPKPPVAAEVVAEPDIFEDPKGFRENLVKGFQTELNKVLGTIRQNSVATSFQIAHVKHGDAFPRAMEEANKLNVENPEHRKIVQDIYNSPDPGEALVTWNKRRETFARVGDDPTAFEERIRTETRESLLKDPEFRKQLLADLRAEANQGDDGRPRITTRLPKSLNGVTGSNLRVNAGDPHQFDGSEQAVADAAWR